MTNCFPPQNDDDLISKARWLQLAGLTRLEPTAAELTAADLTVGCQGYLWDVTLAGCKDSRPLITAERDLASVEASLLGAAAKEAVASIVYRGPITGTVIVVDDRLVERLTKLRVHEEREARQQARLDRLCPIGAMQLSDTKFTTKMTQADGTPVVLTLNKAQAAEAQRLAKSWGPSDVDAIIQKACQNASAANVNLSAERAQLSFFERVQQELQLLLQNEIDAGHDDVAKQLNEHVMPMRPGCTMPGFIIETAAEGNPCVISTGSTPDEDAPTGMHHFDS